VSSSASTSKTDSCRSDRQLGIMELPSQRGTEKPVPIRSRAMQNDESPSE